MSAIVVVDGQALSADDPSVAQPAPVDLATAQAAKVAALATACAAQIRAGYTSDALGTTHFYPSQLIDQTNMMASVVDSVVPGLPDGWTTPFKCAVDPTDEDTWARRPHTAAQIQQAGRDGKAAIIALQAKLDELVAQVAAAVTVADVNALTW